MERTRYREKTRLSLDRVFGPCNKDVRGEKKTADHNDSQKKKKNDLISRDFCNRMKNIERGEVWIK